jgi:hypothetical protein
MNAGTEIAICFQYYSRKYLILLNWIIKCIIFCVINRYRFRLFLYFIVKLKKKARIFYTLRSLPSFVGIYLPLFFSPGERDHNRIYDPVGSQAGEWEALHPGGVPTL